jgi:hypothetical protein
VTIKSSCPWNRGGHNTDDTEAKDVKESIKDESQKSGVPKELILAVVMQESKGCVRAPTSMSDTHNPGLMQSAGRASCNPLNGNAIYPCPKSTIAAMIHDGTAGIGLRTTLKDSLDFFTNGGTTDDSKYYKAVRRYNSGSEVKDLNLGVGATPCYVSDIANRLVEPFSDGSTCDSGKVASLTKSEGRATTLPLEQSQVSNGKNEQNAPTGGLDGDKGISDAKITGAVDGCTKFYMPTNGNSCEAAGVDIAKLLKLNAKLNGDCSNMWAGYQYCIAK